MDDPRPDDDLAPRLLTIEQVASCCQVSTKTVYRAIRRGALRATRLGLAGAYRVKPEEMQTWIDKSTERAPATAAPASDPAPAARPARARRTDDGQLHLSPMMGRRP